MPWDLGHSFYWVTLASSEMGMIVIYPTRKTLRLVLGPVEELVVLGAC